MKRLIIINGTMGVGKTSTCRELQKLMPKNVFLDGDWCWDMTPFVVTEETKAMVLNNIAFLLNSFLRCSEYENIIFCWVIHEQKILDDILSLLDMSGCEVIAFSLVCSLTALKERLNKDINSGVRTADILERSCAYLGKYDRFTTKKIDVSSISAEQAAREIAEQLR